MGQFQKGLVFGICLGAMAFGQSTYASPQSSVSAVAYYTEFESSLMTATSDNAALRDFYTARQGAPIWTGAQDDARREAFFAALDGAQMHGLPTPRYAVDKLRAAYAGIDSERVRGAVEAQISRTFLSYARDMTSGVLTPSRVDPTIVRDLHRPTPLVLISGFAQADPVAYLNGLVPQSVEYAYLFHKKQDLERLVTSGGWGGTVPIKTLHPGENGASVAALRLRLNRMGYLAVADGQTYDDALRRAVRMFQKDVGEIPDGIAGPATLAAVNVSAEDRLRSVIVSMERLRWLNHTPLGERYIWVNIPDYRAQIIDNGIVTYDTPTVVGKPDPNSRTPEFSDILSLVVINPSWHVPHSITTKEYLPKMQRDRYAASQIQIVDKNGVVIPRDEINFAAYSASNFPFRMRQNPSQDNALGEVKFLFPNKWNIYLHDTPAKSLFNRPERALSHGCIRIGKPFELAYALLAPQTSDPQGMFETIRATGQEKTLRLQAPVPVHLVYFTAWPTRDGRIIYHPDVYGRDAALFGALAKAGVEL